jgi:hypothetical protein
MRITVWLTAAVCVVGSAGAAAASPRSTWDRYVLVVGQKKDLEILACYSKAFRDKVSSNGLRLETHYEEIFGLLQRDYDVKVVSVTREGDNATLVALFVDKKDRAKSFREEVRFVQEDGKWLISRPPQSPNKESFWAVRLRMLGVPGLVAAGAGLLLVALLVKKLVSHS